MPRKLGDAWVTISPDTAGFRTLAETGVKKAMAGLRTTVPIGADTTKIDAAIAKAELQVAILAEKAGDLKLDFDDKAAIAKIAALELQRKQLEDSLSHLTADVEIDAALTKIYAIEAQLEFLQAAGRDIVLEANTQALNAELTAAIALVDDLTRQREIILGMHLDAGDVAATEGLLDNIRERMRALSENLANIDITANGGAAEAVVAKLQVQLAALARTVADVKISADASGLGAVVTQLAALEAAAVKARASTETARVALIDLNQGANILGLGLGFLGTKIKTFGGLFGTLPFLGTVSVLHLLADTFVEIAAVVIPATIALAAFGLGAAPTINDINRQMQAVLTTSTALGKQIYPLDGSFQKLEAAVKPSVIQLFGDALLVLGSNMGKITGLAKATGSVLDQLGLRITAALVSGGLANFIKQGPADLAKIGDIIGNIFGTIGNLLKAMPGWAEVLLGIMDELSKALEAVSASPIAQWLFNVTLLGHGFIIWAGLAVTATVAIGNALVGLAARFGLVEAGALAFNAIEFGAGLKAAAAGIGLLATELFGLGTAEDVAAASSLVFNGVMTAIGAINPLVWIGVAVGLIAGLILWLNRGTDSVNQFGQAAQKAYANIPINQVAITLAKGYADTTASLAKSQSAASVSALIELSAIQQLQQGHKQLTATQKDLVASSQQTLNQYADQATKLAVIKSDQAAYNDLLKASGGNLSYVTAAGVTWSQWINASKTDRIQYTLEIQAQADAQKALGLGTGQTSAALNAQTNVFLQETVPAMKKVTDQEDQLLSVITGGEQTWANFQQSIIGTTAKFVSPSGLAAASKLASGDLSGLNDQSLAFVNTLYGQSIPAAQKMFDALRAMGIGQQQLTTVVATSVGEMLQYVGSNQTARTVLVDLINNVLGPGTVSLQNLDKWVKNNSTSLAGMSGIVATTTAKASVLAGVLKTQLNVMLAQAAANALGGQKALDQFAQAVLYGQDKSATFVNGIGQKVLKMFETMYSKNIPQAKAAFIDWAKNGLNLSQTAAENLWRELTTKLTPAMLAAQDKAHAAASVLEKEFVQSLIDIGSKNPRTTQDVNDLVKAIEATGSTASSTASARAQLIKDLEKAGLSAQTATGLVDTFQNQIAQLHGKTVDVVLDTSGQGKIIITGTGINTRTINTTTGVVSGGGGHTAGGRLVTQGTTPTADDVLAYVSRGELIVPAAMVRSGLVDHLRGRIPGFAAGGVAGVVSPVASGISTAATAEAQFGQAAAVAFAQSALQAATAASAPAGGVGIPGGTANSGYQAFVILAQKLGWGPALLQDWVNVEMREAGFSLTATNPSSGAYGMAQFIQGAGEYYTYGGNPNTYLGQATAMANYIISRYGTPAGAWAHEQAFNWYNKGGLVGGIYDRGGILPPRGWAHNTSGKPEMVVPAQGAGSSMETNNLLRMLISEVHKNTAATLRVGPDVGKALNGTTARGGAMGYY